MKTMKIWILDPYHAGSHRDWSCGVQQVLEMAGHQVTMRAGRHWRGACMRQQLILQV